MAVVYARNQIHVIYVINSVKKTGPGEVLLNMVKGRDSKKIRVTVVTLLNTNDEVAIKQLNDADAEYISLGLSRKIDIVTKAPALLRDIFYQIQPDIIHSHGILSDIASYKSRHNSVYIATVHSNIFEDYRYSFGQLRGSIFALWHIFYLRKFDKIVCCSSTSYMSVYKLLANATFVRNGVDIDRYLATTSRQSIRSSLGIKEGDLVYIYVGKLSNRKNVLSLLDNFSSSIRPNEHLLVLGNGELREECEKYASSRIHILGFQKDVVGFLGAGDVYVSASKSEGFSISIIEALGNGLYLLLSDIPSHKEVFSIDDSVYIGEVFGDIDFETQKKKLFKATFNKDDLETFQAEHLSAREMMRGYEAVYREVTK